MPATFRPIQFFHILFSIFFSFIFVIFIIFFSTFQFFINFMSSFFSRFSASFTPTFLVRFRQTTVGQSVGYYFLVWLILFIVGTLVALSFVWHFSAPEKVTSILTRVPSFEFQFQNNTLIKTSFSDDPHILMV